MNTIREYSYNCFCCRENCTGLPYESITKMDSEGYAEFPLCESCCNNCIKITEEGKDDEVSGTLYLSPSHLKSF